MIRPIAALAALLIPVAVSAQELACDGSGAEVLGEPRVFYGGGLMCDYGDAAGDVFPVSCGREAPGTHTGFVAAPEVTQMRLVPLSDTAAAVFIDGRVLHAAVCDAALEPDDLAIPRRAVVIDPAVLAQP